MKECLLKELIPILLTFCSIIKYRKFLDIKHKKKNLKLKYEPGTTVDNVCDDKDDDDIKLLTTYEINSKEYYEVDKMTKEIHAYREFLLEEIVPKEK